MLTRSGFSFSKSTTWLTLTIVWVLMLAPTGLGAQTASEDLLARFKALEARVRALDAELRDHQSRPPYVRTHGGIIQPLKEPQDPLSLTQSVRPYREMDRHLKQQEHQLLIPWGIVQRFSYCRNGLPVFNRFGILGRLDGPVMPVMKFIVGSSVDQRSHPCTILVQPRINQ